MTWSLFLPQIGCGAVHRGWGVLRSVSQIVLTRELTKLHNHARYKLDTILLYVIFVSGVRNGNEDIFILQPSFVTVKFCLSLSKLI